MRNKILILALAISVSSCGIFRIKEKEKKLFQTDSLVTNTTQGSYIDTGSITTYRKTTLFNQTAAEGNIFHYPSALIKATAKLSNSTEKLKKETLPPCLKNNVAATVEEWTREKKAVGKSKIFKENIDLKKTVKTIATKTEGNAKTFTILMVVGAFVFIIICVFVFLYWKARVIKV